MWNMNPKLLSNGADSVEIPSLTDPGSFGCSGRETVMVNPFVTCNWFSCPPPLDVEAWFWKGNVSRDCRRFMSLCFIVSRETDIHL